MLRLACPHCGPRDEAEFRYRGDAALRRPEPEAGIEAFLAYAYERENLRGWHLEYWQHVHGCRRVLKVRRDTLTHAVAWTGFAQDPAPPSPEPAP